ncbi:MAG: long-chain fatty acid--CoA ligase [Chlorobi bacterium]|nr:long-chain fatty acid--CoA ligase [Chlorobiota bacterium]
MGLAVSFSTIGELFNNLTQKFADSSKPIFKVKRDGEFRDISYRDFREQYLNFMHGLVQLGIKQGDRIAILSENRPEWAVTDVAIQSIGAIDVPMYTTLTSKQIGFIVKNSGSVAIVVSNKFQLTKVLKVRNELKNLKHIIVMNQLDESAGPDVYQYSTIQQQGAEHRSLNPDYYESSLRSIQPEDLCTLIYTSGTTGEPKGVMLSHNNFVSNITDSAKVIPIDENDTMLSYLPLSHVFERMAGYYTALACGATMAFAESIDKLASNMLEVKPTIITTVPRLFERIYNRLARKIEQDPPSKKKIFYWAIDVGRQYATARKRGNVGVGLAVKHRLAEKLVFSKIKERTGGRIRYFVSGGAPLPRELGEFFEAVGIIILEGYGLTESSPVITCNRLDDYKFGTVGKPLPSVEVKIAEDGEILARGPNIMMGYFNNPKATEEALDKDGWLHTGDIGTFDGAGFLVITDRKKHLFVSSGGKNIAPQMIENLFSQSQYIDQFVLFGDRREFLSALIVPDFDAVREYADRNGIPYKKVEDLVKTDEVHKLIEEDIQRLQRDLASYERVRRFVLLDKPLSIEDGEITPTLKVRRKIVEERYGNLIETMYKDMR